MRKPIIILLVIAAILFFIKRKDMTWRQSFMKTLYPIIMLPSKLLGSSKKGIQLNKQSMQPRQDFYSLQTTLNNGSVFSFDSLRGKKVLLVNTASDCGYTGQYAELQELYKRYEGKLVIMGFPANDFKQQEQRDDAAIASFCTINYGVTFPLAKKSVVIKTNDQNPVFAWLSQAAKNGWCNQEPTWNFCKYLIDEKGSLEAFFPQTVSPLSKEVLEMLELNR
jgi:glutathione peroxidase